MAITFDSVDIEGLRYTHFYQLYSYLKHAERDGEYYGRKDQFLKRHGELKEWLEGIMEKAGDPEYIIPKKKKNR